MSRNSDFEHYMARIEREEAERYREEGRRHRQQVAQERDWADASARASVAEYERQRHLLLSMHKRCGPTWRWQDVAERSAPPAPKPTRDREQAALDAVRDYAPSLFARVFGGETVERARLQQALVEAQEQDARAFAASREEHTRRVEQLAWERQIAQKIVARDTPAYRAVIDRFSPFAQLAAAGMRVSIETIAPDVAVFRSIVASESAVPREATWLAGPGRIGVREIAPPARCLMFRDFVCGGALGVAREAFALLPLQRVIVNVNNAGVDGSTGHPAAFTILAVSISLDVAEQLRYDSLDPSAAMSNFPHRMRFDKWTGFDVVTPMTSDETSSATGGQRR